LFCSYAEADDAHFSLFQTAQQGAPAFIQILTVTQNDQEAIRSRLRTEGIKSTFKQGPEIGAALGQKTGFQLRQELAENLVVRAERSLQKGGSRKDDQTNPFALKPVKQCLRQQLRSVEAAG